MRHANSDHRCRDGRSVHPHTALAGQPLPVTVGTLDALHLSTALLWRDCNGIDLVMATHDAALASAARAMGLGVLGT